MNFVFFSPHFPSTGTDFCDRLKKAGVTVLGIGDAPYDSAGREAEDCAVGILPDLRHGELRPDAIGRWGISSTNGAASTASSPSTSTGSIWKPASAPISTSGASGSTMCRTSSARAACAPRSARRGVNVIAQKKTSERAGALEFIRRVGYPVVVKPDSGAGAAHTYKISNSGELDEFFRIKPEGVSFVMEEFIDGLVVTFDGLVNRDGEIVFAASSKIRPARSWTSSTRTGT